MFVQSKGGLVSLKDISYSEHAKEITLSEQDISEELDNIVNEVVIELVKLHTKLINDVEKGLIPQESLELEVARYIDNNNITLPKMSTRKQLVTKLLDYIFGYGILQEFIDDNDISDIRVMGTRTIRIKSLGKRGDTTVRFASEKALLTFCYYVAIKNKGNLSESTAIQRLSDTKTSNKFLLRIDIAIPPVTRYPVMHIRKLDKVKHTAEDLIHFEMFNEAIKDYYIRAVRSGLSMIFCGRGGSGKTTLMNLGLEYVPHSESVLVMQETDELFCETHPEFFTELVKPKSGELDIEYSLRYLTVTGLLQDLDRMIIGEIKGEEAMDFFNAAYTGHICWTSLHAPNARGAIPKAVHYMKYSGTDLSAEVLTSMLAELDLVIFMRKYKVIEIAEIAGLDDNGEIIYNTVFEYKDGEFKSYPSCERIKEKMRGVV